MAIYLPGRHRLCFARKVLTNRGMGGSKEERVLAGQLALIAAALFTGAAVYVSVAEQPARLALDDRALLAEWKPAYKRGFAMQASLALIGFLLVPSPQSLNGPCVWLTGALCFVPIGLHVLS